MELTGITKSMLDRAVFDQSLLAGRTVQTKAVEEVAKCIFEHGINEWLHMPDEQKEWDRLPQSAKLAHLVDATWLIGRLAHSGFIIIADPKTS